MEDAVEGGEREDRELVAGPQAAATSHAAVRGNKLGGSVVCVRCRSTSALTGPANISITPTASTRAAIMILMSRAIPTAVMTESSEKTISSTPI